MPFVTEVHQLGIPLQQTPVLQVAAGFQYIGMEGRRTRADAEAQRTNRLVAQFAGINHHAPNRPRRPDGLRRLTHRDQRAIARLTNRDRKRRRVAIRSGSGRQREERHLVLALSRLDLHLLPQQGVGNHLAAPVEDAQIAQIRALDALIHRDGQVHAIKRATVSGSDHCPLPEIIRTQRCIGPHGRCQKDRQRGNQKLFHGALPSSAADSASALRLGGKGAK